MTYEDSSSDLHGGGAFATPHGSGEAENEPFLSELDLAPTRSRRSLSSDNSSTAHRSHHVRAEATVRTQLLYALPPRLSQWLASSSEADDGDAVEAAAASHPGRRQSSPASHSDAAASTLRVPVTLRVLPGNAPPRFAMVSHRRSSSSSLHEIRIDSDDDEDSSLPPLVPPSGTPSTHSHESTTGAAEPPTVSSSDDDDDLSTLDEFASLFRRCHQTLPFLALFVLYFVFQHIVGLAVFALGSVAIAGLDQRLRAQIALKELANRVHLVGILAICVIDAIVISSLDGELNPFKHLTLTLSATSAEGQPKTPHGALILDLLWIVLVNDFIVRFSSLAVKAVVALVGAGALPCGGGWHRRASVGSPGPVSPTQELQDDPRRKLARSSVTFYRRKRKLYGIIEVTSIIVRSLLAGLPWCSYYQLCGSKFLGDVFTFLYVFGKSVILGTQARQLLSLVRSFLTLGLDHATYVTREEVVEAGSPDCSICYEPMQMPVKLACTHLFCEDCVMEWLDRERSCPLCRAPIVSTTQSTDGKPQYLDGSTSLFPQLF